MRLPSRNDIECKIHVFFMFWVLKFKMKSNRIELLRPMRIMLNLSMPSRKILSLSVSHVVFSCACPWHTDYQPRNHNAINVHVFFLHPVTCASMPYNHWYIQSKSYRLSLQMMGVPWLGLNGKRNKWWNVQSNTLCPNLLSYAHGMVSTLIPNASDSIIAWVLPS